MADEEQTSTGGAAPPKTLGQAVDELIATLTAVKEDARLTAVKAACESLGLDLGIATPNRTQSAETNASSGGAPTLADIRSLKQQKNPSSTVEMACVLAYYLQNLAPVAERKNLVTSADIDTYFRQADYPLPKALSQVLIDAKAAGYFDATGRGSYRLNAVGHNLVAHSLPRTSGPNQSVGRKYPVQRASPKHSGARKRARRRPAKARR